MNLETLTEPKHEELLSLLNPLVDFMHQNNFNFFLVAGKDGICTRHLRGNYDDVVGMITGMMQDNKQVDIVIRDAVNDVDNKSNLDDGKK